MGVLKDARLITPRSRRDTVADIENQQWVIARLTLERSDGSHLLGGHGSLVHALPWPSRRPELAEPAATNTCHQGDFLETAASPPHRRDRSLLAALISLGLRCQGSSFGS